MEQRSQIKIELVKSHISELINYYSAILMFRTFFLISRFEMISKVPANFTENTSRIYFLYLRLSCNDTNVQACITNDRIENKKQD